MFTIANFNEVKPLKFKSDMPLVIDGAEAYDTLCPVSKLTGHRANPLSLLKTLANDPAKSRLLDSVLQEVNVQSADPSLSNDDLIKMSVDNLHSGTFFEDDAQMQRYMDVVSDFVNSRRVDPAKKQVKQADVKSDSEIINNV